MTQFASVLTSIITKDIKSKLNIYDGAFLLKQLTVLSLTY